MLILLGQHLALTINSNGDVSVKEGHNGQWETASLTPFDLSVDKNADGYIINLAISWDSIEGKPNSDSRVGFSIGLRGVRGAQELI